MDSDDIPPEVRPPSADEKPLHPYAKLAITYTGIGLFFYIFFFGAALANILTFLGVSFSLSIFYPVYFAMIALMIFTIYFLKKGRKLGGYLFLVGVTLYHFSFIPYPQFLLITLIPTGVVTGLFLTSIKHLR